MIVIGFGLSNSGAATAGDQRVEANVPSRVTGDEVGQIQAERAKLFEAMMRDPTNLDIAFSYAALSSKLGDLEGAISTLERMLIFSPGLPRLQLELGVLYFRLSSYEQARNYFEAAISAPDVPDEVRRKVDTYIAAIDDRTQISHFSGTVMMGMRWQSNANAATNSRRIETTLFPDPLLLNDTALADPDFNAFLATNLRYSYDLQTQGDTLDVSLQTYGALYAKHNELNVAFAELHFGPTFNMERFDLAGTALSTYAILSGYVLDNDPYLYSAGLGATLTTNFDLQNRLTVNTEYRREGFQDTVERPTSSDRTGDRYRSTVALQHLVTPDFAINAILLGEVRSADKDYLSYRELGASLGVSFNIAPPAGLGELPWTIGIAGGYSNRAYDDPDPTFSTSDAQNDNEAFAELSLLVPFDKDWALQTVVAYRNVNSNYDIYAYHNVSASVGIARKF